ncbi:Uncharacterised protein r2_g2185 [Pycnogonum litorale]
MIARTWKSSKTRPPSLMQIFQSLKRTRCIELSIFYRYYHTRGSASVKDIWSIEICQKNQISLSLLPSSIVLTFQSCVGTIAVRVIRVGQGYYNIWSIEICQKVFSLLPTSPTIAPTNIMVVTLRGIKYMLYMVPQNLSENPKYSRRHSFQVALQRVVRGECFLEVHFQDGRPAIPHKKTLFLEESNTANLVSTIRRHVFLLHQPTGQFTQSWTEA